MMMRNRSLSVIAVVLFAFAAGCHKKTAPAPPPPPPASAPAPPPAAKPTIDFFNAEPDTISRGQSATLRWSVKDAASITIDTIGAVSPAGSRAVFPKDTTTYHLTATSDGGTSTADATVTISAPPPPPPPAAAQAGPTALEILAKQVQDLHFDYDKSDVRPDDQAILQGDATALKTIFSQDASFMVTIEGHCDERGSAEYNLALGDRRANATKDALVALGVPGEKLKTVSYGKERPICTDQTESCYAQNRRAHFAANQ